MGGEVWGHHEMKVGSRLMSSKFGSLPRQKWREFGGGLERQKSIVSDARSM